MVMIATMASTSMTNAAIFKRVLMVMYQSMAMRRAMAMRAAMAMREARE